MTRTTPLHSQHVTAGASMVDFAGWTMPVRYSSDIAEHHAVRSAAGLFDLSHMGEIEVRGADAAAVMDYAHVGTPSPLGVGRARYSMICAPDGGIIDDLVVYRLAESRYLIVANAANVTSVVPALAERCTAVDALVDDVSERWALIAIQGPIAARVLGTLTDTNVEDLKYYAISEAALVSTQVLLARTGYTGEDGFEIYCNPSDAPRVWAALLSAGRADGLVPAGLACRDTLRLEAGMPLYGHELRRDLTPYEAGLGRVVNLDKADFVGRAALLERSHTQPSTVLVGLHCEGRRSPRTGYDVLDPNDGTRIGTVTSGAPSPTLGLGKAKAYVPP